MKKRLRSPFSMFYPHTDTKGYYIRAWKRNLLRGSIYLTGN